VEHIIASHALISMASTVVRHDWDDPLMRPCYSDHCALSVHAAISPRPRTTRKASRRVILDNLSDAAMRKPYQAHVRGHAHTWWQLTQHVDMPAPEIISRAADSLSAGLCKWWSWPLEPAPMCKGAPSLGSRRRRRSRLGSSTVNPYSILTAADMSTKDFARRS
jgi:hypothetical protein